MPRTVSAEFDTRRDAEMAVEHIVQEHGVDPKAVAIVPVAQDNSAGTTTAGADIEGGHRKTETEGEPALAGRLRVTVDVDDAVYDQVLSSFSSYKPHDR